MKFIRLIKSIAIYCKAGANFSEKPVFLFFPVISMVRRLSFRSRMAFPCLSGSRP